MLAALLFVYTAFQVQNFARGQGFDKVGSKGLVNAVQTPTGHQMFVEVLHIVSLIPNQIPYSTPGTGIFFVLINPIPRHYWPQKPLDQLWIDYAFIRAGSDVTTAGGGATIAISVIGQFYAEGGMIMVMVAGLLWGAWAWLNDDLLRRHGRRPEIVAFCGISITLLLLNYRGLSPGLLYVAPALLILLGAGRALERVGNLPHNLGAGWLLPMRRT